MEDGYRKITQVNSRRSCPDPSWIHGPDDDGPSYSTDLSCGACGYQEDSDNYADADDGHWLIDSCPHCDSPNITCIHLIDGEEV